MAVLSPKELQALSNELFDWYMETREYLIAELTAEGFPYGSVPLSDEDLVEQYFAFTEQELFQMRADMMLKWGSMKGMEMFDAYQKDVKRAAGQVAKRAQEAGGGQ